MKYKSNRNIVFSCSYHVVFCPKYRRPVLVDGVDERFKEIAWEVADELGFEIAEMEVMPDHVHLLLSIDPQLSIHRAIKRIKGRSSHDLREEFPWLKSRIPTLWTNSYFVSTVGGAPLAQVLAKAVSDASFGEFARLLEYKCAERGRTLVRVDRFYPSSKTCSVCGHRLDALPLSMRSWDCPACGAHHDRDVNAARNILAEGKRILSNTEGTAGHAGTVAAVVA